MSAGKVIAAAVCVGAAGAGFYFGGAHASSAPGDKVPAAALDGCTRPAPTGTQLTFVDLPSTVVNLADGSFLRVTVTVGLCPGAVPGDLPASAVDDIVVSTFTGTRTELVDSEAGRNQMRIAILHAAQAAYPDVIGKVLFTELAHT